MCKIRQNANQIRTNSIAAMGNSYMYYWKEIRHSLASARIPLSVLHASREQMISDISAGGLPDVVVLNTVTCIIKKHGLKPSQSKQNHTQEQIALRQMSEALSELA